MNKQYLIFGAIGVIVLATGGFLLMQKGNATGGVANSVTQGMAKLFNAECRYNDAELCKFMNDWEMPTEYAMRLTMTSKGGPKTEFESIIKGEDSHTTMKESGKVIQELITLSGVDYIKDLSDGKWWKVPKEKATETPAEDMIEVDYDFTEKMQEVEDKTTYVRIGMDACGSAQCYKYEVVDPANKTLKEFIWFDDEDYLMRKKRSEEIGGEMSVSEVENTYGNMTIVTPAPVKEGTALDVYGASSGMSKAEIEQMKKDQVEAEKEAASYMKMMNNPSASGDMQMQWGTSPDMPQDAP